MKFLKTVSLDQAIDLMDKNTSLHQGNEMVPIVEALGRYLFSDILSDEDVPYYNRSTVDGYAVISQATQGASDSIPVTLKLKGALDIGTMTDEKITPEDTMYIPTGGMVPDGADAMVMIEDAQLLDDLVLIQKPASAGLNLVKTGEDVKKGETVLSRGHRLKPQDLGALAQLNHLEVSVLEKPRVFIISTGDEFAGPLEELTDGKIRDVNTYAISALAGEAGFLDSGTMLVPDDLEEIKAAIDEGLKDSDLVLLSGGSSAGDRDFTKKAIEGLGGKVLFHGIRIKPGKPTIGASIDGVPVIGLPGHPVSAMMIFKTLVMEYFQKSTGCSVPKSLIKAKTQVNFPSVAGRLTCQFLTLTETKDEILCKPYYSNSALVSQLTQAQGYAMIAEEEEGVDEGTVLDVILL